MELDALYAFPGWLLPVGAFFVACVVHLYERSMYARYSFLYLAVVLVEWIAALVVGDLSVAWDAFVVLTFFVAVFLIWASFVSIFR